jgi:hypothetical protein
VQIIPPAHSVAICNVQNEDKVFNIADSTLLTSIYYITYETGVSHNAGQHTLNEQLHPFHVQHIQRQQTGGNNFYLSSANGFTNLTFCTIYCRLTRKQS